MANRNAVEAMVDIAKAVLAARAMSAPSASDRRLEALAKRFEAKLADKFVGTEEAAIWLQAAKMAREA